MRIAVLAATGPTGRHLVRQALERGHSVVALARNPGSADFPAHPALQLATADVTDPDTVVRALAGVEAVVSGLGIAKGDKPGALTAGARAVTSVRDQGSAPRVVWLGAFGSGGSAQAAGHLARLLLKAFLGNELPDKTEADAVVLAAGGTVFHADPLTNGPLSPTRRTLALVEVPRRLLPRPIARATVAAAMLDEAEHPKHPGHIAVPRS